MARLNSLIAAVTLPTVLLWAGATLATDPVEPYNPEADPVEPEIVQPPAPVVPDVPTVDPSSAAQSGTTPGAFNPEADPPAEPPPPPKPATPLPEIACDGQSVCREPDTGLPARVLARAFSKAYKDKSADDAAVAVEAMPALTPLYVFARDGIDLSDPAAPAGWYQVADSEGGPPLGWLQAKDAVEWRQALVVAYTHPGVGEEERKRVLMFEYVEDLQELTESDDRDTQAQGIYGMIDEGKVPAVIVSKEPERFVSITEKFYLLPIVDHRMTDIDGDEARYLRLAAAVPEKRGPDTLAEEAYAEQAKQEADLEAADKAAPDVDIVFVMDMTRSMQPYIDNTRKAVMELAGSLIAAEGLQERVRFGLVGYRDSVEQIPALEFTARNFTPELLSAQDFNALVESQAKATRIGSVDYAEEVYAGVEMAIDSSWRENSLRFLILVGDASAHPPGHKQSTTGKDAPVLKQALTDAHIHPYAVHLKDYRMGNDHPIAEGQFSTLAKVQGSEKIALRPVDIGAQPDYAAFADAVEGISGSLVTTLKGDESGGSGQTDKPADGPVADPNAVALRQAALVEYLGRAAEPPKDILVWALDRDLTNPTIRSMEVRVLITKEQLSNLILALDGVMQAMAKQQQEQIKLFEALQSVASATMKNPDQIGQAGKLAETGLLPKFIEALPYRSEILSLTEDSYASLTADQRAALETSLLAKLEQYRDINESDAWIKLNSADADAQKVFPLHLSYLP
jgi:serine/threonine-protein kinase PpkA